MISDGNTYTLCYFCLFYCSENKKELAAEIGGILSRFCLGLVLSHQVINLEITIKHCSSPQGDTISWHVSVDMFPKQPHSTLLNTM